MTFAAIIAAGLLTLIAVFQLALAFGAPLGAMAWGGQHPGVLPTRLRIASGVAGAVVYPLIILVVLAAGGLIGDAWLPVDPTIAMWGLSVLLAIGALANFASRSPRERPWGVVALAIAICCLVIALTG
jgi:hypothetical protein